MDHNPDEVRVASLSLLAKALGEQMTASRPAKNLGVPSLFLIAGMDSLVDERDGRKGVDSKHGLIKTLACGPEGKSAYALEGSVFIAGAAYLAGLAAGFWKDTAEIGRFWTIDKEFAPVMARRRAEGLYGGWKAAVARTLT